MKTIRFYQTFENGNTHYFGWASLKNGKGELASWLRTPSHFVKIGDKTIHNIEDID